MKKKGVIYLDNAATTPMDPLVIEEMIKSYEEDYGNPSSVHSIGRKARGKIELVRKKIAKYFNASASEFTFTSGGTESNNMAIRGAVASNGVKHIVTSKIEHPSVLSTVQQMEKKKIVKVSYVKLGEKGIVDLVDLERLLKVNSNVLVSLMHGNNEVGNILPIEKVAELCIVNDALFHCDSVQTVGHLRFDLKSVPVHYLSCSAHKIHGPKGVGFLYTRTGVKSASLQTGGKQERGSRSGTENIQGIIGMGKALSLAYDSLDENEQKIQSIKDTCIELFKIKSEKVQYNGDCVGDALSTILNVELPTDAPADMFLFQLDIDGVVISGGSACSSGSVKGSHVLEAIKGDTGAPSLRLSFSRFSTQEDVLKAVKSIVGLL